MSSPVCCHLRQVAVAVDANDSGNMVATSADVIDS